MMHIVGIDEVGRGPLAGPVSVCAVVCEQHVYVELKRNKNLPKRGLDSKKLSPEDRERAANYLKILAREKKISYSIVHVSNKMIDSKGLSFCIKKAIAKALKKLELDPATCNVRLDGGLKAPEEFVLQQTIIKGDEKEKIIAWASILAKVSRDNLMQKANKKFAGYGFDRHKGYATVHHRQAIIQNGLSVFHRASFCRNLTKI